MVLVGWKAEYATKVPSYLRDIYPAREDLRTRASAVRWTSHARKSKVETNQPMGIEILRQKHSICTDRAAAGAWLAAEEAGYVTGATIHVNGGMAMV